MMEFLKNTLRVVANAALRALRQLADLALSSGKQATLNATVVAALLNLIERRPFVSTFASAWTQGFLLFGLGQLGFLLAGPAGRLAGFLAGWALVSMPKPAVAVVTIE